MEAVKRPMSQEITPGFRRLAAAAALATYLLIIAGGVVRITGSGLGCPDWPLCYGRLIPPLESAALIEYTHRTLAAVAGGLIAAVAIAAWVRYRHQARIAVPAALAAALLAVQIPLGRIIVLTELSPQAVAYHLGMALLIFGCMLIVAVAAQMAPSEQRAHATSLAYRMLLVSTLAALFLLMISGAVVVGSGGSFLCPQWPLCEGRLVLVAEANPGLATQLLHRYTALIVSALVVMVIGAALRHRDPIEGSRHWAWALGGLYVGQIAVGAMQVMLDMLVVWRWLHLALAAAVWAALAALAALTFLGSTTVARPRPARQDAPSVAATSK